MEEIKAIYLSWRKGRGHGRHIVGIIKKNVTEGIRFSYIVDEVRKAESDGFKPYPDFPEIDKEYKESVIEIFGQRLTKPERSDIKIFTDFWAIDEKYLHDKYYLLAHTQGWLPTDNFEFLADFYPIRGLTFITDIAGMPFLNIKKGNIVSGDRLRFELEPENEFERAVSVWKGDDKVGYIKRIHNKVFYSHRSRGMLLKVRVVEENGIINRAFVLASL